MNRQDRTALVHARLHKRQADALARVSGAGMARVGDAAAVNHAERTHSAVLVSVQDIQKWKDATIALARKRPDTTSCFKGGDVSGCLTPAETDVDNFITSVWDPFVKRWDAYYAARDYDGWFAGDDEITKYDNELAEHRSSFSSLASKTEAGDTLKTAIPTPQASPGGGDGGGNPISSLKNTIYDVIIIAGLGLLLYVGGVYILPALFGAAASTKRAARHLKES
jgi:hypothetical protein